jgi:hypothetical protein
MDELTFRLHLPGLIDPSGALTALGKIYTRYHAGLPTRSC